MPAKIAVAIVHGICVGNESDELESSKYAGGMAQALKLRLADIVDRLWGQRVKLDAEAENSRTIANL